VWGDIVGEWLDELLPAASTSLLLKCTFITATPAELCKGVQQTNFDDKAEVVAACRASIHIPFFMDTRPCIKYRDRGYFIEGSFWPFVLGEERFQAWSTGRASGYNAGPPSQAWDGLGVKVDWRNDEAFALQEQLFIF